MKKHRVVSQFVHWFQLLSGIHNQHVKGTSWDVLIGPFYVYHIAPYFRGIVPNTDRALFRCVPVHLHFKGSSRAMDSDLECPWAGTFGFHQEFALETS